ncbi:MAG: transposase [Candidatus Uhrbacteria bacterium]
MRSQERKSNRLPGYDYSKNGFYFVTICVEDRTECFGEIVDKKMILNEFGEVVENQWLWLEQNFFGVYCNEFVIMPNHFHGILEIDLDADFGIESGADDSCRDNPRIVPTLGTVGYNRRHNLLSKTINAFKTTSSKIIHQNGLSEFKWQRSFYDNIIRDEQSFFKIQRYILENPKNLERDRNKTYEQEINS